MDVVEEAQLKELLPLDASAPRGHRLRASNLPANPADPLAGPRHCKLFLSKNGFKLMDASHFSSSGEEVFFRQPLHSILVTVSFLDSQNRTLLALALKPDADQLTKMAPSFALGAGEVPALPAGGDVFLATCVVFQCSASEQAAELTRHLKSIFAAASENDDQEDLS